MRPHDIAIAAGLLLVATQANAQTNLGFEAGDTSGWTVSGGFASVAINQHGQSAADGQYFLSIAGGCQTTTVSQTIPMAAGETLQGWGAFLAYDYLPYNDWASAAIEVYGGGFELLFYADVAGVGSYYGYGILPWTPFQFTAQEAGSYTVVFSSSNGGDCAVSSYGLFDLQWIACSDPDGDGVCDEIDNCASSSNADQANADADAHGDACDACPVDADNDADADGYCGDVDNCPFEPNNQADSDGDGSGDACDTDDDADAIEDLADNCPYHHNPTQTDTDLDGDGDACDLDDDADGIGDGEDACETAPGQIVDATGCSIADLCPCDAPWKNHGAYVACVAHATTDFQRAELIDEAQRGATVSEAAESSCGHPQ